MTIAGAANGAAALLGAGAVAAVLLRRAWADRARERRGLRVAGWSVIAAAIVAAAMVIGPMLGLAYVIATVPLGALSVIAAGATRRRARAQRTNSLAPEPLQGEGKAWRGWLKALLAGPLGMLAAMGVAFCYAAWSPGAVQTRLLIAALLVPVLWALGMTWTLADQRLLRATAVLSGTVVMGFGLALLGGIA